MYPLKGSPKAMPRNPAAVNGRVPEPVKKALQDKAWSAWKVAPEV
jgi:hypothetical protein